MKRNSGITLIALTVTIIVLIILASVSMGALTGDNGIINQARQAKEETEISEEKEIIDISVIQTIDEEITGNIEKNTLQEKLNTNVGEGKTEVIDGGNTTVVKFVEKNRYYEIDDRGNIDGPKELTKDPNAGDLSKGETADGSEQNPFQINCIEDLVTFSIMVNGGNVELGIKSSVFKGQYVALMRTLDFNSIFSYNDHTTTKFGDLNTDGIIENIKIELTKTSEGCVGFTPIGQAAANYNAGFNGIFDGKGNAIDNIYQNYNEQKFIGLFGGSGTLAEIKNLTISGNITNKAGHAAGISAGLNATITNCKNYANVTGYNMVGGISAWSKNNISDCINYGDITIVGRAYSYAGAGGIAGSSGNCEINNCINKGDVNGSVTYCVGGIVGYSGGDEKILNCINEGDTIAGILGWTYGNNIEITNCYNIGKCINGIVNGVSGAEWSVAVGIDVKNSYNLGETTNAGIIGEQGGVCASNTINIENCYNGGISNNAIIATVTTDSRITVVTNISNTYYDNTRTTNIGAHTEGITGLTIQNNTELVETLNSNIVSNTEWKKWKLGEYGYPTFE